MKTEIFTVKSLGERSQLSLNSAATVIKDGGLVIFPTETVYGLGGDATNPSAAKKIYEAKGRPSDNPLIIHVDTPEMAEKYAYTNETYYRLAKAFMPGPLTLILKAKDTVPIETRGGLDTVAVRCPENEVARELIRLSEVPIAAPSANLSGSPSPTSIKHVIDDMLGRVDVIIDGGDCNFGLESTIVKIDGDTPTLLRPGKITPAEISAVIGEIKIASAVTESLKEGERALSPGMKYRHYAPAAPLALISGAAEEKAEYIKNENHSKPAIIAYQDEIETISTAIPNAEVYNFGKREDLETQAHILFYLLREIDKKGYDMIYAPLPEQDGIGLALYNRMIRAAAHKIIRL